MQLPMNPTSSSLPPQSLTKPEPALEQRKSGRPSSYTPELGAQICEELTNSCKSLRTLCAEIGISRSMLFRWLQTNEQFRIAYQRAKENQADFINDELITIADDTSQDTLKGPDGGVIANPVAVHRSKLRIETRKYQAARLQLKRYLGP